MLLRQSKSKEKLEGAKALLSVTMLVACVGATLYGASNAFVVNSPIANRGNVGGIRAASVSSYSAATPVTQTSKSSSAILQCFGGLALLGAVSLLRPAVKGSSQRSIKAVRCHAVQRLSAPAAPMQQRISTQEDTKGCLMMSEMPSIVMPPKEEHRFAAPVPLPISMPSAPVVCMATAATPSIVEENLGTGLKSCHEMRAARFVAGSRRSASSRRSSPQTARRAARRSVGARLSARPVLEATPVRSFDASRLRMVIQTGLAASSSSPRFARGREACTAPANRGTATSTDGRIQEKDLIEHRAERSSQNQFF
eukprot:TRINITY_DN22121_c2_g1_i1.p1 TRINITY_DN22121_c2_g1~~TRINITY_DN22121_c2_g1_i1.p1  ORF type:complete len:311 (+),score=52.75 TRINITY_DN22121_c2_g1_i1:36-968(+)